MFKQFRIENVSERKFHSFMAHGQEAKNGSKNLWSRNLWFVTQIFRSGKKKFLIDILSANIKWNINVQRNKWDAVRQGVCTYEKLSLKFSIRLSLSFTIRVNLFHPYTILIPLRLIIIYMVFFHISKLIFSVFPKIKGNSVRGQNNSKYRELL